MLFKTILAVVGCRDEAAELNRAIELATQLGAHLSVLVVELSVPPTVSDYPVGTIWLDARVDDMKQVQAAADRAIHACETAGIPFDVDRYYTERAFLPGIVFQRALYADLVVVGEKLRAASPLLASVVDGAVFDAQRPLLLLPAGDAATSRVKTVLLAWNSRAEAGRAAREAIDFLANADSVHVTLVDPDAAYHENGGEPGGDVAAFLTRHGVNVIVDQLPSGGRSVEDVLKTHAREIGADLIVMGAYGHSRLRERVFGGVTQSMLESAPVPVLIAR
ncbi:Nucleotide-binding universal stress protein, UspA family [Rhizobium sp. RU35A]|uniref:universal stress protein n=1 Tax=Rhizobium sp. RU35A TaxID=1907414 RepID=UPI0009573A8B|nr:universal stress protein [Rhizobium sp. RU35A]SIQ17184.1 Nucleotide-binding universal stress protein, UspA family [Rhizobium sp. RU35A]